MTVKEIFSTFSFKAKDVPPTKRVLRKEGISCNFLRSSSVWGSIVSDLVTNANKDRKEYLLQLSQSSSVWGSIVS